MLRDYNKQNIITKSQVYMQMSPCNIIDGIFAKTINYHGIYCNFCLDIPEITEEEKKRQEKQDDIAKFTAILMSDFDYTDVCMDNPSKNNYFVEIFDDEVFKDLACNENLLSDLGII